MSTRQQRQRRQEAKRILYQILHRFGTPAQLYKLTSSTDVATGARQDVTEVVELRRFASFEVSFMKKFEYNTAFTQANKNFAYGGIYEVGDRIGFIDHPSMNKEWYFILDGRRYNIQEYNELDFNLGYTVHLRSIVNQKRYAKFTASVHHFLTVEQEVGTE